MPRVQRTRLAILGMLSTGEKSGYDLKKEFERRMRHFWAESAGQIYPTLRRLLEEGLVTVRRGSGTGRRERTVYALTAKGKGVLQAWLREPPQPEQVRNEILLKLYFGPELGVDGALAHLQGFEAAQRGALRMMEAFQDEIVAVAESEEQEVFWKITLASGLHVARARIAWCEESRRLLAELKGRGNEPVPPAGGVS